MCDKEMSDISDFSDNEEMPVILAPESSKTASASRLSLMEKLDNLTNVVLDIQKQMASSAAEANTGGRKRKRSEKVEVPVDCAEATRNVYNALMKGEGFTGYNLKEPAKSVHNEGISRTVFGEVAARFRDRWSEEAVLTASRRYHKSLRDKRHMEEKGTVGNHKTQAKRRNTRMEKQKRRLVALEKIEWSPRRKERIRPIIQDVAFLSSDEEGDPASKEIKTKVLPWESQYLAKAKSSLDNYFLKKCANARSVRMMYRHLKNENCHFSSRGVPEGAPSFAVKKEGGSTSLDDSITNLD